MLQYLRPFLVSVLILLVIGTACSTQTSNEAPQAVLNYMQALVEMDENLMINYSCAEWEQQARLEHKSFAAVEANLESPSCQVSSSQGDTALVVCSGKIIANYGAEDLEIDLTDREYRVVEQAGEWRFCGYE